MPIQDDEKDYKYDNSSLESLMAGMKGKPTLTAAPDAVNEDEQVEAAPPAPPAATPKPTVNISDDEDNDQAEKLPLHPEVQNYLQKLQAAQEQSRNNQLATGITAGLQQITHGLSRAPGQADTSAIINAGKNEDNTPVNNLVAQQAGQMEAIKNQKALDADDPDSDASKSVRQQLAAVFPDMAKKEGFENITASQFPNLIKLEDANASNQQRDDAAKDRKELGQQRLDILKGAQGSKDDKQADVTAGKMGDDLDPHRGKAGNFGLAGKKLMSAQAAQAIFDQYPDGNVPKAQTHELALAAAGLISNGSAQSQSQINSMVPHSLVGDANGMAAWLTNDPRGSGQQAFIQNLKDSVNREMELANKQILDVQKQRLGKYASFIDRYPEKSGPILRAAKIDPQYIQNGQYAPPDAQPIQSTSHPQDSVAVQWAKNNLNDPRAKAILKANGIQ